MDTIPNSVGCDSIITLNLTIISIDTGVTILTEDNWFANATSGTFQWIECAMDSVLPGETNAGFQPSVDGSYAVIITDNGCSDTSECIAVQVVGVNELGSGNGIDVYPNPNTGKFVIEASIVRAGNLELTVVNSLGQEILVDKVFHKAGIYFRSLDLSGYSPGIYTVKLGTEGGDVQRQVVIE